MSARKPSGFSLIELLAVITIIGVLIGLLIPAVLYSRESARRNTCTNNQHEIAVALQQYESATGRLPGFVNSIGGTGGTANGLTWAAMLCPYMGMNDVWAILRTTNVSALGSAPTLPNVIPRFLCPSDAAKGGSMRFPLSYVGNCGWYDAATPSLDVLQGIFTGTAVSAGIAVRTDEIPDGAQNTLMLSENIDATQWFTLDTATGTNCRQPYVVDVGMLWCNPLGNNAINAGLKHPALAFPATEPNAVLYLPYARPSSRHPGGVVATYCDGHTEFLADTIAPAVYQSLMSPNDAEAKANGWMP